MGLRFLCLLSLSLCIMTAVYTHCSTNLQHHSSAPCLSTLPFFHHAAHLPLPLYLKILHIIISPPLFFPFVKLSTLKSLGCCVMARLASLLPLLIRGQDQSGLVQDWLLTFHKTLRTRTGPLRTRVGPGLRSSPKSV